MNFHPTRLRKRRRPPLSHDEVAMFVSPYHPRYREFSTSTIVTAGTGSHATACTSCTKPRDFHLPSPETRTRRRRRKKNMFANTSKTSRAWLITMLTKTVSFLLLTTTVVNSLVPRIRKSSGVRGSFAPPSFFVHTTRLEEAASGSRKRRTRRLEMQSLQKGGGSDDSNLECGRDSSGAIPHDQDDGTSSNVIKLDLNLVLIDHYDSYTYNLYDMLARLCVNPPTVLAKDADWNEFLQSNRDTNNNTTKKLDGIILSPGPGTPTCDSDMGMSLQLLRNYSTIPILGVCLGHQAMGHVYCGNHTIQLAPCGPVHGQVRQVEIDPERPASVHGDLWKNVSNPLNVVRYHSLVVALPEDDNSSCLIPTAWSYDDSDSAETIPVLMGLQHATYPHYGVQFHPESIGTHDGLQLLRNFCEICDTYKQQHAGGADDVGWSGATMHTERATRITAKQGATSAAIRREVMIQKVKHLPSVDAPMPEHVFSALFESSSHAVWLDSSNADNSRIDMARCSIMAAMDDGPLSRLVEYYGREYPASQRKLRIVDSKGHAEVRRDLDVLSYLRQELAVETAVSIVREEDGTHIVVVDDDEEDCIPFEYRGGFLGFLGYEVHHDTLLQLEREEYGHLHEGMEDAWVSDLADLRVPTAAFLFADRSLVFDHWEKEWYLVGVAEPDNVDATLTWMKSTCTVLQCMSHDYEASLSQAMDHGSLKTRPLAFVANRSRKTYESNIAICHDQIRLGESYELCLTNQLETRVPAGNRSPLDLYKILRRRNPAPFAAYLNFQGQSDGITAGGEASMSICCSSPERFVSTKNRYPEMQLQRSDPDRLYVEAKPIKGTCARPVVANDRTFTAEQRAEDRRRAKELASSVKNRAENLMIVDLLRNDLSRVCEIGSVHVPKLMQIESYATVHQMVSTIRGMLDKRTKSAIDVLTACFPGGSMTGAPKLRTMDILHGIEESVPRGPYSGCLGYISLNGSMDMNIVIRTAILTKHEEDEVYQVRIGAGGAITALSESEDEYEEMLLKARAVMEAVQSWSASARWRTAVVSDNDKLDFVATVEEKNWTTAIAD